ncbi:hypothetical protein ACVWXM_005499 [Bradyrhizobium sp. GM7.3]
MFAPISAKVPLLLVGVEEIVLPSRDHFGEGEPHSEGSLRMDLMKQTFNNSNYAALRSSKACRAFSTWGNFTTVQA